MNQAPIIVLLPGLDGTGILFQPLIAHLPQTIEIRCFSSEIFATDCIATQAQIVSDAIMDRACIIFAESFAGRLAFEIIRNPKVTVAHVVFAASFLQRPSFFSRFAAWVPLFPLYRRWLPNWFLNKLLFGQFHAKPMLLPLFYQALARAPEQLIRNRLAEIAQMHAETQMFTQPCTYIAAKSDYLVNAAAAKHIACLSSNFSKVRFHGGHFIAQCQPAACAELLLDLVRKYTQKSD
jgi:hypothetical protein